MWYDACFGTAIPDFGHANKAEIGTMHQSNYMTQLSRSSRLQFFLLWLLLRSLPLSLTRWSRAVWTMLPCSLREGKLSALQMIFLTAPLRHAWTSRLGIEMIISRRILTWLWHKDKSGSARGLGRISRPSSSGLEMSLASGVILVLFHFRYIRLATLSGVTRRMRSFRPIQRLSLKRLSQTTIGNPRSIIIYACHSWTRWSTFELQMPQKRRGRHDG